MRINKHTICDYSLREIPKKHKCNGCQTFSPEDKYAPLSKNSCQTTWQLFCMAECRHSLGTTALMDKGTLYSVMQSDPEILRGTCVCLLKCLDAQFSMSVSEEGFLRVNSGKMPQLALGIIFLAFRLASNWTHAPRSSD